MVTAEFGPEKVPQWTEGPSLASGVAHSARRLVARVLGRRHGVEPRHLRVIAARESQMHAQARSLAHSMSIAHADVAARVFCQRR